MWCLGLRTTVNWLSESPNRTYTTAQSDQTELQMNIVDYMDDTTDEMRRRSEAIRRDFAMHRGAAGDRREDLVINFLKEHLPKSFAVRCGFAISSEGRVSNQADVLVVDEANNAPLHPNSSHELWPVEAIYALIEVKTRLSPDDLQDAVKKCRRFKQLKRQFLADGNQKIQDSLFVIWSFDGAASATIRSHLVDAVRDLPTQERPDLVVDLAGFAAQCGGYLETAKLGQPNSEHRRQLMEQHGTDLSGLIPDPIDAFDLGANSLLVWYVWFDSWLRHAGARRCDPLTYLPPGHSFGQRI